MKKELLDSLLCEESTSRAKDAPEIMKSEVFEEINETLEIPKVISVESIENFEAENKPLTSTPKVSNKKSKLQTSPLGKKSKNEINASLSQCRAFS